MLRFSMMKVLNAEVLSGHRTPLAGQTALGQGGMASEDSQGFHIELNDNWTPAGPRLFVLAGLPWLSNGGLGM